VVDAADADDVAAAVRVARGAGLVVSAQAAGHGASGDVEGVVLVRTRALDALDVRPDERLARVGAGVRWGEALGAAAPHGLAGLAGSSPVVSVVGYTLGGGLSWFGRRWGLAADGVRAIEAVDAEGSRITVTADDEPELFWALRGGGGDFALVTGMTFDLHPAPELVGGRQLWPVERAPEVFDAFRRVTASAPDRLTVWADLLHFPGADPWVAVDATYLGPEAEARDLLAPFDAIGGRLSDGRAPMSVAQLGDITAEPTDPSPGLSRAELLTGFDADVIAALVDEPIDPLLSVQVRHLGGALARPTDSAAGGIAEPYLLYLFGVPSDPATAAAVAERQAKVAASLGTTATGRRPQTVLAPTDDVATAFPPATLARLQEAKRRHDPHGVFRSNHPVLGRGA
jgi:FAD/FMN-containing dehydrogenase